MAAHARPDPPFTNGRQDCVARPYNDLPTSMAYMPPLDLYYCTDFCAPGLCEGGLVCELVPTSCWWDPCPMEAICLDQCSWGCKANEVSTVCTTRFSKLKRSTARNVFFILVPKRAALERRRRELSENAVSSIDSGIILFALKSGS